VYQYAAPYQLIHDNLLDLSHIGYVHQKTIGGNAQLHMNAGTTVTSDDRSVRAVRLMPNSAPPPSYLILWPFGATCDRWQEIEFHVSYLAIWTGAMFPGEAAMDDPERGGLHTRGFHGVTPETDTTSHYFWTMAANRHPSLPPEFPLIEKLVANTRITFEEDKAVIEAQYRNMQRFNGRDDWTDIHVDLAPNRARRVIAALLDAK
jgi:vanillate O-demethylase monooxygenase subunit